MISFDIFAAEVYDKLFSLLDRLPGFFHSSIEGNLSCQTSFPDPLIGPWPWTKFQESFGISWLYNRFPSDCSVASGSPDVLADPKRSNNRLWKENCNKPQKRPKTSKATYFKDLSLLLKQRLLCLLFENQRQQNVPGWILPGDLAVASQKCSPLLVTSI